MNENALSAARDSSHHLADLLRREHASLADFLVALAAFDRKVGYRSLGFANLFEYLQRELGLSRGAAHYRKVAARLVDRFPEVVEPLRDGRLCLSSVLELAKVISESNRHEVLPRFFHRSREEARQVAVEIAPATVAPRRTVVTVEQPRIAFPVNSMTSPVHPDELPSIVPEKPRTLVEPLTATRSRIHLTVSRGLLAKLRKARAGQSHVQPGATDEQVIEAALDLLLAQQEKRRASVPPRVKREVRKRDAGKCTWPLADGGVCGSTVRLEVDHVVPRGKDWPSTADNCRILCRVHNLEAARAAYGDEMMDLFAPRNPVVGEACSVYFVDVAARPRLAIRPRRITTATVATRPASCSARSAGPAGGRPATPSRVPKVAPAQAQAKVMGPIPRNEAAAKAGSRSRVAERA